MKTPAFLVLIFVLLLSACGDQNSQENSENTSPEPIESVGTEEEAAMEEAAADPSIPASPAAEVVEDLPDFDPRPRLMKLEARFDKAPFYTKIGDEVWFYVVNGNFKRSESRKFPRGNFKMGIVNGQDELVLPVEYDKIYNPDGTSPGYIELEKEGKRGLYGYKNGLLIPCEYEVLFPPKRVGVAAIGRKGKDFFRIMEEGKAVEITDRSNIPRYISDAESWTLDFFSGDIKKLYDSYYRQEQGDPLEPNGIKFVPSYFLVLEFLPEFLEISQENVDFGPTAASAKVKKSKQVEGDVSALITSFYEEGIDARGYQLEKTNLVTVDGDNQVYKSIELATKYPGNAQGYCEGDVFRCSFPGKGLLEVEDYVATEGYGRYDGIGNYRYYKIAGDGSVTELLSDRFFDCSKFVKMNENHFEVCATSFAEPKNPNDYGAEGDGNLIVLEHMAIEDLDIMRNEIFADYGYRFKTVKWKEYFGKKDWYRPVFDNVDDQLTDVDRHNIDLILKVRKRMEGREDEVTGKHRTWYVAAG